MNKLSFVIIVLLLLLGVNLAKAETPVETPSFQEMLLSDEKNGEQWFHFYSSEQGKFLRATIDASNGDADLSLWYHVKSNTDASNRREVEACSPSLTTSKESCTLVFNSSESFISVRVRAAKTYRNLKLTIELLDDLQDEEMGEGAPKITNTHALLMDNQIVENGDPAIRHNRVVKKGEFVSVILRPRTTKTEANLFIKFDEQASHLNYDCNQLASEKDAICSFVAEKNGELSILVENLETDNPYYMFDLVLYRMADPILAQRKKLTSSWTRSDLKGRKGSEQDFYIPNLGYYLYPDYSEPQLTYFTLVDNNENRRRKNDADLYVKFDGQVSLDNYDCKSTLSGSNEECVLDSNGKFYATILVKGYTRYKGVSLKADYIDKYFDDSPDKKCRPGVNCRPGEDAQERF